MFTGGVEALRALPDAPPQPFAANSWEAEMTELCESKFAVLPRKGDAIVFYSQDPHGGLDPASLHGGCPVLNGTKWAANLWVCELNGHPIEAPCSPFTATVNSVDIHGASRRWPSVAGNADRFKSGNTRTPYGQGEAGARPLARSPERCDSIAGDAVTCVLVCTHVGYNGELPFPPVSGATSSQGVGSGAALLGGTSRVSKSGVVFDDEDQVSVTFINSQKQAVALRWVRDNGAQQPIQVRSVVTPMAYRWHSTPTLA